MFGFSAFAELPFAGEGGILVVDAYSRATLTSVSTFSNVATYNAVALAILPSLSTNTFTPEIVINSTLNLGGISNLSSITLLTHNVSSSLTSSGVFNVYPLLLEAAAALINGTSSSNLVAFCGIVSPLNSTINSTSILNGNVMTILSAIHSNDINRRVTESGDIRITNLGDFRTLLGITNASFSTCTASPTVSLYNGSIAGVKADYAWGTIQPYVKHSDGSWVVPKVYVNDNSNTWKRVA